MFKHLLLPADGSALAEGAVRKGLGFAKSIAAKVTVIHVVPPFTRALDDGYLISLDKEVRERFEARAREHGDRMLESVRREAEAAGGACNPLCVNGERPCEEIINAAQREGCDLIMMASHGRSGIVGLLLGSETAKVLNHTTVPVLVVRSPR
jgi:nucleotide-binding universal stress UspA family protein